MANAVVSLKQAGLMDRNGVNNTFLMSSSTRLMERTVLEVSHIRDSLVKERNGWKEDLLIERENKKV